MLYKRYKNFYKSFILYVKPSFLIASLFFYKGCKLPTKFYTFTQSSKNAQKPIFCSHTQTFNYLKFYRKFFVFIKLNLSQLNITLLNFNFFIKFLSSYSKVTSLNFIIYFNKVFTKFTCLLKVSLKKKFLCTQIKSLFLYKLLFKTLAFFKLAFTFKHLQIC
jgi:hypothetical protein